MTETYITSFLMDQMDDYPSKFPKDFDFDAAVDQINTWFDDQIVYDHLEELLTKLLNEINPTNPWISLWPNTTGLAK